MRKWLSFLLALLPLLSSADNISLQKAAEIANRFFSSGGNVTRSTSLRMIWDGETAATRSASAPAFYVFNNEGGKGFVIVSGDDCTSSAILGYSFDQNFSAENMPANLNRWMNGIRSEILSGRKESMTSTGKRRTAENAKSHTPVKYLETALWDQGDPYNSQLPLGYVTGCPATAISIVMRYHEWPEKGVGTILSSNENIPNITLGHTYDWNNMPLDYTGANQEQKRQVGILMRDVGAMIQTQYGQGSAGANPENTLPLYMPVYMRYNASTIKSYFKSDFSDAEWHAMLQKELNENRPVLYGGYSSGGGHQFVLDGYDSASFYHVNWGWSGVSNGYYLLTDMKPPLQGTGGSVSADGFTQKQDAIIGIQPDPNNPGGGLEDNLVYKGYPSYPYGISADVSQIVQNQSFKVNLKELENKGTRVFRGQYAVAHFAVNGRLKGIVSKIVTPSALKVSESTELMAAVCTVTETIEAGDYIAGVVRYNSGAPWFIIRNGYPNNKTCTEKIVLKDGGSIPSEDLLKNTSLSYSADTKVITLLVPAGVTSVGFCETSSNKDCSSVVKREGNKVTISTASLAAGNYTLTLSRNNEKYSIELTL